MPLQVVSHGYLLCFDHLGPQSRRGCRTGLPLRWLSADIGSEWVGVAMVPQRYNYINPAGWLLLNNLFFRQIRMRHQ